MPSIKNCRQLFLASLSDGKEESKYIGDFLLKSASQFSEQLIYGLISDRNPFESDLPIEKVNGAIPFFYLICDDGNLGLYHGDLIKMYRYLSRLQWERGDHDEAFDSLESALNHVKTLEKLCDGREHTPITAPLVYFVKYKPSIHKDITKSLPDDWPFWCNHDYSTVEKESKADPRWKEWVKRTQA